MGGSSIKAGLVDVGTGNLVSALHSVPTPTPATPERVVEACVAVDEELGGQGPVGLAFPSVIYRGVARTAAHVDAAWVGTDGGHLLGARLGRPVAFLNDADAAGLAEMKWARAGRSPARSSC